MLDGYKRTSPGAHRQQRASQTPAGSSRGWAWPPNPWGCIKRDRRRRLTHSGTGQSSAVPHPIASANELQPTQLPCSVDLKVWCRQDLAEDGSKHARHRAVCAAQHSRQAGWRDGRRSVPFVNAMCHSLLHSIDGTECDTQLSIPMIDNRPQPALSQSACIRHGCHPQDAF